MKRLIMACKTVEEELRRMLPAGVEIKGLEQGLHRHPDHLKETLQQEIDASDANIILLAYGLCGNGVVGLKSEKARLVVPRVDDCISVLLGSYERYREEFDRDPGTYWLSHGWILHSQDPFKEYERVREKYDDETARWVASETMKGYHRVALIETSACDVGELRPYAQQFADFFKLDYQELRGSDDILRELLGADFAPDRFVVAEPGEAITTEMFLPSAGLPNG